MDDCNPIHKISISDLDKDLQAGIMAIQLTSLEVFRQTLKELHYIQTNRTLKRTVSTSAAFSV